MTPNKPKPTKLQYLFAYALIIGCGAFITWIVSTCVNDFMLESVSGIPKILYSSLLIFLAGYVAFHQFIAITHFLPASAKIVKDSCRIFGSVGLIFTTFIILFAIFSRRFMELGQIALISIATSTILLANARLHKNLYQDCRHYNYQKRKSRTGLKFTMRQMLGVVAVLAVILSTGLKLSYHGKLARSKDIASTETPAFVPVSARNIDFLKLDDKFISGRFEIGEEDFRTWAIQEIQTREHHHSTISFAEIKGSGQLFEFYLYHPDRPEATIISDGLYYGGRYSSIRVAYDRKRSIAYYYFSPVE